MSNATGSDHSNASWLDKRTPLLYDWYDECPYDLDMWHSLCESCRGPILDLACGTDLTGNHRRDRLGQHAVQEADRIAAPHGDEPSPG